MFEEWIDLASRSSWTRDDAAWWYNERASVGLLAGAVWKANGWSFEEYSTQKQHTQEGQPPRRGRADLWIEYRGGRYAVEAKQSWVQLGGRKDASREATSALAVACGDASKLLDRHVEGAMRVGVVFVVPWLSCEPEESLQRAVKDFDDLVISVSKELGPARNLGWVRRRADTTPRAKIKNRWYAYPGVILMAREASPGPRRMR